MTLDIVDTTRDLLTHRLLYTRLIRSHYSSLYSGSRLGLAWIVLGPIFLLALYSLTYSVLYKVVLPNFSIIQYITNVYAGLILLLTLMNILSNSSNALRRDFRLRSFGLSLDAIPMKVVLIELVPLSISMGLLSVLSVISTRHLLHLLWMPFVLVQFTFFCVGVSRLLCMFAAVFKDIQFLIPYVGIVLLLVTPISYVPSMIPAALRALFMFNPLYYYCVLLQTLTIEAAVNWQMLAVCTGLSLISSTLGARFFRKTLPLVQDSLI